MGAAVVAVKHDLGTLDYLFINENMVSHQLDLESIKALKVTLWILSVVAMILAGAIGSANGMRECLPFLLSGVAFSPLTYSWLDEKLNRSGYVYIVALGLAATVSLHSLVTEASNTSSSTIPSRVDTEMSSEEIIRLKTRCEIAAKVGASYYVECVDEGRAEWEADRDRG